MQLSIIVPILNEEKGIRATLENIAATAPAAEVILVDGGSVDTTCAIIAAFLAERDRETLSQRWQLLHTPRGRGLQMNLGATRATGEILLFLHADTHLPEGAAEQISLACCDRRVVGGNFRIRFTPHSLQANLYSLGYNLRSRFQLFYGDSGLWVRREIFEQIGGYPRERLMEDFALVLRLRRTGRLVCLRGTVESSARRFQGARRGLPTLLTWMWLHLLLFFGAGDETLDRIYHQPRKDNH